MDPEEMTATQVETALDEALEAVTHMEALLKNLSQHQAEELESQTTSTEYLDFLSTVLYGLNSAAHSYSHLKSKPLPEEFVPITNN